MYLSLFCYFIFFFFLFNDTATTEIYTLSLHDALPILLMASAGVDCGPRTQRPTDHTVWARSEEHTSELQSRENLVCRLLLEKKKQALRLRRNDMRILVGCGAAAAIAGAFGAPLGGAFYVFVLIIGRPSRSTLFPYTTLFRSRPHRLG